MDTPAKRLLRDYHENGGTTLGHTHWSVSERTWREWMSPANKRQPPASVIESTSKGRGERMRVGSTRRCKPRRCYLRPQRRYADGTRSSPGAA